MGGGSSVSFLILIVLCFSEYFVFVSFVSCNHWNELSIGTLSFFCVESLSSSSLSDFSLRVNVFYIKGCIRFFSFFLVLFFCLFSTTFPSSFFFPDWPTRFLQLTKGAITLFYDKQLCYTTTIHFFCYKQLRGTVTLSYGKQVPRQILAIYFLTSEYFPKLNHNNFLLSNCITSFLSAE